MLLGVFQVSVLHNLLYYSWIYGLLTSDTSSPHSARAKKCHDFLAELSGSKESGPALT